MLLELKKKKEEYDGLMEKLQREVCRNAQYHSVVHVIGMHAGIFAHGEIRAGAGRTTAEER